MFFVIVVMNLLNIFFLECVFTWNVWSMCLSWRNMSWVIPNNFKLMFKSWCAVGGLRLQRDLWCSLFFFLLNGPYGATEIVSFLKINLFVGRSLV